MKRLYSLLLALGIGSASLLAQTVTVFMKDNTVHKYNAEYLSKIAVREVAPTPDEVEFKTIDLNVYSYGNVTVTMENENVKCVVDLYGTEDALFLQPGVYNVDGSRTQFTVDPAYSQVTMGDETSKPASGSVTVSYGAGANPSIFREASNDHDYTINVDLELENGKKLVGKYVGELPSYTPWINVQLTQASYNENPQPAGQFYVKLQDANWHYDMALIFMADPTATTLPAGTYRLSDIANPGSLLSASYVDGYGPNFNTTLLEGSEVIVTKDGDNYHMDMALRLSDGRDANFTFDGTISGTPTFQGAEPPEPISVEAATLDMEVWNSSNITLRFYSADNSQRVDLDTYLPHGSAYLPTGVYNVGGYDTPRVDTDVKYTYYAATDADNNNTKTGLLSGTLTVTREGLVYTFVLDAILDDGYNTPLNMTYTGTLPKFSPEEISAALSGASYNVNAQPTGQFYVKFNDADWNYNIAIVFAADESATVLPAGTYTPSDTTTPGSILASSYVEGYSPYFNCSLAEGSEVTVALDGDNYNINMNLKLSDGRDASFTYEGPISGTPTFQ